MEKIAHFSVIDSDIYRINQNTKYLSDVFGKNNVRDYVLVETDALGVKVFDWILNTYVLGVVSLGVHICAEDLSESGRHVHNFKVDKKDKEHIVYMFKDKRILSVPRNWQENIRRSFSFGRAILSVQIPYVLEYKEEENIYEKKAK